MGDSFDNGILDGGGSGAEAEAPVRCARPDCAAVVTLPDTAGKLAEWASYKGEGTFWFCPEHKRLAKHPRS